jgi:16S rRNA (guanine966-N2)-methyltransferase
MADHAGRVIAGRAAGRRLAAAGPGIRPLTDRVKQTLFAILEPELAGARFLDLCAGTGAGAIEALSRGAAGALLVEHDARACRTITENLSHTRLAGPTVSVVRADAIAWLTTTLRSPDRTTAEGAFNVVLLDPPYEDERLLEAILELLGGESAGDLLAPEATIVAKHFWRTAPPARIGLLRSVRERRFGETTLTFYRRVATEDG